MTPTVQISQAVLVRAGTAAGIEVTGTLALFRVPTRGRAWQLWQKLAIVAVIWQKLNRER